MPEERSEYRLVYNWGQSTTEICEVLSMDDERPHAYVPLCGAVGTHDDEKFLGDADEPADRLRELLTRMLEACDKPVLKFPEDFAG